MRDRQSLNGNKTRARFTFRRTASVPVLPAAARSGAAEPLRVRVVDRPQRSHGVAHGLVARMHIEVSGGRDVGMPEDAADRSDVDAVFDRARRERVAQCVVLDVRQPQRPEKVAEIVAEIVGIDAGARIAEEDVVFRTRSGEERVAEALVLEVQQRLQEIGEGDLTVGRVALYGRSDQSGAASIAK